MTLRHFRIFLAVCERLSMTEAARQLHISQPSVTQAIHEMEDHYGILLFERLGRHIYLTAAGENLKQYAYQILSLCQQAEDSLTAMQRSLPIRLGASITIGDIFLVELLTYCRRTRPDWSILSAIHNTEELEQFLIEVSRIPPHPYGLSDPHCLAGQRMEPQGHYSATGPGWPARLRPRTGKRHAGSL